MGWHPGGMNIRGWPGKVAFEFQQIGQTKLTHSKEFA